MAGVLLDGRHLLEKVPFVVVEIYELPHRCLGLLTDAQVVVDKKIAVVIHANAIAGTRWEVSCVGLQPICNGV